MSPYMSFIIMMTEMEMWPRETGAFVMHGKEVSNAKETRQTMQLPKLPEARTCWPEVLPGAHQTDEPELRTFRA